MDYKRFLKILPLILGLLIIPIFMRFIAVPIPYDVQLHWKGGNSIDPDIFGYGRLILLIITSVIIALILFFTITSDTFVKIKKLKPFFIALGILLLMAIISTILGGYGIISFGGAPTRYEGLYAFIGYFLLFSYAMIIDYDEKTEKTIIIIMSIFTILCSLVGLSQFMGKDIFLTSFGKMLYLPPEFRQTEMQATQFVFRTMYIFTTHYNYASMLMSMMSMFWVVYAISVKDKRFKILSAVMAIMSMLLLFGTNARSGVMAIVIAIIIMMITFISKIISNKKASIIALVVFLLFVFTAFSFGLMSRVTSLIQDIKSINSSRQQSDEHIREQIPLKDIKTTDDTYTIVYNDVKLRFDKNTNSFYDDNDNVLTFDTLEQGKVTFRDERYKMFTVETSQRKSNIDETNHMYHLVRINNETANIYNFDVTDKVMFVNHLGLPMYPEKAERIGFKGMERLGSGRMFIISSTLPLIKKSPIIGYGPDAFLMVFNQDDVYAKMYVYGEPMHIVDKPHNLYLLFAINFGLIGLFAFLYIIVLLILKAKKKYKNVSISQNAIYISSFAGVMAYMGSGFFNDSSLAVSPIFWVLLGIAVSGICIDEVSKISKTNKK